MMMRLRDGTLLDVEPPVRGFHRYSSEGRANIAASFRLGHRQRQRVGEAFWTHPRLPGVCYPTRAECIRALMRAMATSADAEGRDDG